MFELLKHPNLLLHCGAELANRESVSSVSAPQSTETWMPIPHLLLIQTVEQVLTNHHLRIGVQAHSLSHHGDRYFGLMEIQGRSREGDYCRVLGLRNSHDKTFPAGIVAGTQILVCDNLSFSGEIKLTRRHTRFILRDLPMLVHQAISRLIHRWKDQDERIAAYKARRINDSTAHDLVIRATDHGVCSNRLIPTILHEWRSPSHEVFAKKNAWRLFNAFTEALKGGNLMELPKRTELLHHLLDAQVGMTSKFSTN